MEQTTETLQVAFATRVSLDLVVILNVHYMVAVRMTSASAIKPWDTKETCVKSQVVPDSLLTVVIMEAVTRRPFSARAILPGRVWHATFQTALVAQTAMRMVRVWHPQQTVKHQSATARKDGWALLVKNPANLGLQLVSIFASVTTAIMGLPVTCCAQTIVLCV